MLPKWHFIAAAVFSAILSFFWSWWQILLFFTAAFFIDVDHYLYFVWKKKSWSLKKAYIYFINLEKGTFRIFHTIEVFAALAVLSAFFPSVFFPMLLGFVLHNLLDMVPPRREKKYKTDCSHHSLILYAIKNAKAKRR